MGYCSSSVTAIKASLHLNGKAAGGKTHEENRTLVHGCKRQGHELGRHCTLSDRDLLVFLTFPLSVCDLADSCRDRLDRKQNADASKSASNQRRWQ